MFEQISETLGWLLGLKLKSDDLNVGHMSLRAAIVFIAAVAMIRIGDKRFMGKSTALDVMLGIVFGSVVSRAITGNAPFFPTLAASLVLVLMHFATAAVAFRSNKFGKLAKGSDRLLVRDGEIDWQQMRKAHITEADLREAMRGNGSGPDIKKIKAAHLERNGDISVISE
jgi:uncharacterized membrane protein YcaP (DUF421 family)